MRYKIQEHKEVIKSFTVYEVASNGEICRKVASCDNEKDANKILSILSNMEASKDA